MKNSTQILKPDYLTLFLRSIHIFSDLDDSDIDKIKNIIERKHFKKGLIISSQGDMNQPLYLLESGKVRVYKNSPNGKEQVIWLAKPGDVFCIATIFKPLTPANIQAMEDTMAYAIGRTEMQSLVSGSPLLSMNLLRYFAEHLVNFANVIEEVSFSDVSLRLVKMLVKHTRKEDCGEAVCAFTQNEIASMIGTAREVVCRALKKLEAMDIVSVKYQKVIIKDFNRLYGIIVNHQLSGM